MKAVNFDYVRAGSIPEICDILEQAGPDAKLIAGGQSLVPMLAMRLTKPSQLVDINPVDELKGVTATAEGLVIGGGTRQYQIQAAAAVAESCPIIHKALFWVGHPQTRNRGTLGGSLVHADPSAELPLVSVLLDADIVVASSMGEEILPASEFFLAPMVTALQPDQCVVRVAFPAWQGFVGSGFHEVSPRRGDFALVSAAAQVELDDSGRCVRARVGLGGVDGTPIRVEAVEEALQGTGREAHQADALREIARLAHDEIDPDGDLHASPAYRREVACVLIERALQDALAGAQAAIGVL